MPECEGGEADDIIDADYEPDLKRTRRMISYLFSNGTCFPTETPKKETPPIKNMTVYCSMYSKFFESENKTCGMNDKTLCKDCKYAFIKAVGKAPVKAPTTKPKSRFEDII